MISVIMQEVKSNPVFNKEKSKLALISKVLQEAKSEVLQSSRNIFHQQDKATISYDHGDCLSTLESDLFQSKHCTSATDLQQLPAGISSSAPRCIPFDNENLNCDDRAVKSNTVAADFVSVASSEESAEMSGIIISVPSDSASNVFTTDITGESKSTSCTNLAVVDPVDTISRTVVISDEEMDCMPIHVIAEQDTMVTRGGAVKGRINLTTLVALFMDAVQRLLRCKLVQLPETGSGIEDFNELNREFETIVRKVASPAFIS
jgi:hypothetical protein